MVKRVMVVIREVDEIRPIEQAIVHLAATAPPGEETVFHLVSTDEGHVVGNEEMAPRRLRLMLLLAKLADQSVMATGEDADLIGRGGLAEVVARVRPDAVFIADADPRVEQILGYLGIAATALPLPPAPAGMVPVTSG